MLEKLARYGVLVLTYQAHTSQTFQVLDVLLFGLVRGSKKYQTCDDTLPIHVDHVLRLFRAYEAAMANTTIRAAWRQTGFEYENRNMTTYLSINEGQIRESRDLREIWPFDYHDSYRRDDKSKSGDRLTTTSFGRKKEQCSEPRE
jgi:hypothetical protein